MVGNFLLKCGILGGLGRLVKVEKLREYFDLVSVWVKFVGLEIN